MLCTHVSTCKYFLTINTDEVKLIIKYSECYYRYSYYCEDSVRSNTRDKVAPTVATCMSSKEGNMSLPAFRCFTR